MAARIDRSGGGSGAQGAAPESQAQKPTTAKEAAPRYMAKRSTRRGTAGGGGGRQGNPRVAVDAGAHKVLYMRMAAETEPKVPWVTMAYCELPL